MQYSEYYIAKNRGRFCDTITAAKLPCTQYGKLLLGASEGTFLREFMCL